MTDKTIHNINEGILIVACCTVFILCGFSLQRETASIVSCVVIWCIPIVRYVYNLFQSENTKSNRAVLFVAIQLSILVLINFKYDLLSFNWISSLSGFGILLFTMLIIAYLAMNYWIIKGFLKNNSNVENEDEPMTVEPIVEGYDNFAYDDISEEGLLILKALDNYSQILGEYQKSLTNIKDLQIPIPTSNFDEQNNALSDYQKELVKCTTKYKSYFVSFEQFILTIGANTHIGFDETLLSEMKQNTVDFMVDFKVMFFNTFKSIGDFCKHTDLDSAVNLLTNLASNVSQSLVDDISTISTTEAFNYLRTGILTPFNPAFDVFKGLLHTIDEDNQFFGDINFENLTSDFVVDFKEHLHNFASSVHVDVNVDVFAPDFNCDAHFPIFMTIKEAASLGSKLFDEDVNIGRAVEKSATRIGFTASGAYIGNIIGTLICPGPGSVIGSMVGSWFGRKIANDINSVDLENYKEQYECLLNDLKEKEQKTKTKIGEYVKETNSAIRNVANDESKKFNSLKEGAPQIEDTNLSLLMSVLIMERDYLLSLISNTKGLKRNEIVSLKRYLPTKEMIIEKPNDSLKKILASQTYLRNHNIEEDKYNNSSLINNNCLYCIMNRIAFIKGVQLLFYNKIYTSYKNSVSTIMKTYNNEVQSFINKVDKEKKEIDYLISEIKNVAKKIKQEVNS